MPFPSIRLLDVQQLDPAVALFEAQLREHGIATSVHDVRRFDALATEMPTPLNSATYAWDVREMKAAGILDFATELHNPNFADIAQAEGLFGVRVEYPEALEEALKKAFEHHGQP